jgi:hypothetical protein
MVVADPNGAADLSQVHFLINTSVSSIGACYVTYYPSNNLLYLRNDAGTAFTPPMLKPGAAGTVSNSQCTLDAGASSVSTSGQNLTLNLSLSFSGTFVGAHNVYLYAIGAASGLNSGWVSSGTWTE